MHNQNYNSPRTSSDHLQMRQFLSAIANPRRYCYKVWEKDGKKLKRDPTQARGAPSAPSRSENSTIIITKEYCYSQELANRTHNTNQRAHLSSTKNTGTSTQKPRIYQNNSNLPKIIRQLPHVHRWLIQNDWTDIR